MGLICVLFSRAVIFNDTKIIESTEVLIVSLVLELTQKLVVDPLFFVNQKKKKKKKNRFVQNSPNLGAISRLFRMCILKFSKSSY